MFNQKERRHKWEPVAEEALQYVETKVEAGERSVFEKMGDNFATSARRYGAEIGKNKEALQKHQQAKEASDLLYNTHDKNYQRRARRLPPGGVMIS